MNWGGFYYFSFRLPPLSSWIRPLWESLALIERNYHMPTAPLPPQKSFCFLGLFFVFVFKTSLSSSFQISLWLWKKDQLSSSFGDGSLLRLTSLTNNDSLFQDTVKWGIIFQNLHSMNNTGSLSPENIEERGTRVHFRWNLEEETSVERGRAEEKAN